MAQSPMSAKSDAWPSSAIQFSFTFQIFRVANLAVGTRLESEENHVAGVLFQFHVGSVMAPEIGRDPHFDHAVDSLTLLLLVRNIGHFRPVLEKSVIAHLEFDLTRANRSDSKCFAQIQYC
jgi:hypothetical protein